MKIRIALLAAVALTGMVSACRSNSGPQAVETGVDTVDSTHRAALRRLAQKDTRETR